MTRGSGRGPAPRATFTVTPKRPYSLALTAARYARFPEAVDRFDGRAYSRLLPVSRSWAVVQVRQFGSPARARLAVTLFGPAAETAEARRTAADLVAQALGGGAEVAGFYRSFAGDPVLSAAIRDFRGLRIAGLPSLWEALVTAVLTQQVNLAFAYDIRRHLAQELAERARIDGQVWFGFPEPEGLLAAARRLRGGFRLSGAKSGTLLRLAEAFSAGELSAALLSGLPDEEAIERLTAVKGVGRWTAEIALLRGLARQDVFPAADLGVVKYLARGLLGHAATARESEMRSFAERWRPYRGLALVYAYAELARREAVRAPSPSPPSPKPASPPRPPSSGTLPPRRR